MSLLPNGLRPHEIALMPDCLGARAADSNLQRRVGRHVLGCLRGRRGRAPCSRGAVSGPGPGRPPCPARRPDRAGWHARFMTGRIEPGVRLVRGLRCALCSGATQTPRSVAWGAARVAALGGRQWPSCCGSSPGRAGRRPCRDRPGSRRGCLRAPWDGPGRDRGYHRCRRGRPAGWRRREHGRATPEPATARGALPEFPR